MIQPLAVSLFLGFWAALYLLDRLCRSNPYTSVWYTDLLVRWGLSVHIFQLRWYTGRFNRLFLRIGSLEWFPWRLWFTVGILFGACSMLLAVFLLSLLAFNTLSRKPIEKQVLTPVMPGVNLPLSQLGYYLCTLLLCGVLHEIGHAVAAVRERVRVSGFGLFVLGIYPGAYVDLPSVDLQCLSPLRQLRIYCAGVWHNGVIVLVALAVLQFMPTLMMPSYRINAGVAVTFLQERSVITGRRGLYLGDTVTYLNNCPVHNTNDWYKCIELNRQHRAGYCLSWQNIRQLDVSVVHRLGSGSAKTTSSDCCRQNLSASHLCFESITKPVIGRKQPVSACLPARTVSERPSCLLPSDCPQSHCLAPRISPNASTRLVRVVHSRRPAILFFGDPLDLAYTVGVSDYVPKFRLAPLGWPYFVETLCKYLISLSGALAIINVVPCFALDGQYILYGLMELVLSNRLVARDTRQAVYFILLLAGSLLLVVNVGLALWFLAKASVT